MGSYTIVAIPCQDDYVWKLSSEKIPHMTILNVADSFGGEDARVLEFIQHVIDVSLTKFGMSVEGREVLGPQQADVLMFNDRYCQQIRDFRANLLKDPAIFQAYNAVPQYEEWTPHLTLGYPATPAKPDNRDYPGIGWVNFDKIAVWTSDYSGPEFKLESESYDTLAYSELVGKGREYLEHFGVKGMRWGVRNSGAIAKDVSKAASGLRRDPTKEAHKTQVSAAGGLHKVSDKDLKVMLQRLENEKKFQTFMQADAERRKQGLKTTVHILGQIGKVVLPIALSIAANRAMNNRGTFRTSAYVSRPAIGS